MDEEWWVDNRSEKPKLPSTAVFVNPFDSYLFHTSATFRRQWLDAHLSQLDSEYKKTLSRFQKNLRQRNALLGLGSNSQNKLQLMALDEQFSEQSFWLVVRREEWLTQLNQFITPTFREIFAESHELLIDIESKYRGWNAKRIYDVDSIGATNELSKKTGCSKKALEKIISKGEGAYLSQGSRPNQTAQSWGIARLASSITSGKAAAVDYNILEQGCKNNSKALKMAKQAREKYGYGKHKVPKVSIL
jgi:hypothetical protein